MSHKFNIIVVGMLVLLFGCTESGQMRPDIETIRQQASDIERGRYVIVMMGCNDCHTPDYLVRRSNIPEEDWLVGSNLGFRDALGTSYPTNLRLLLNDMSEDEWLDLARQMRKNAAMADVLLPEAVDQDLRSIYRFIKYLGPKGVPAPTRLAKGVTPLTPYIEVPIPH